MPLLRAADVGIAMGGRGTDVAREAAALVLLDDDFGQIVESVALGRRIGDDLRKAALFICAVRVPIATLALLPWLGGLPVLLWPVHIALLQMVIDPVCSIAFEAEPAAADLMQRPPRSPTSGLLAPPLLLWGLLQGAAASLLPLAVLFLGQASDWDPARLRAVAFVTLVAAIVGLILASRAGVGARQPVATQPAPVVGAVAARPAAGARTALAASHGLVPLRPAAAHRLAVGGDGPADAARTKRAACPRQPTEEAAHRLVDAPAQALVAVDRLRQQPAAALQQRRAGAVPVRPVACDGRRRYRP
jgi:Ca2+-transporting ATPase